MVKDADFRVFFQTVVSVLSRIFYFEGDHSVA